MKRREALRYIGLGVAGGLALPPGLGAKPYLWSSDSEDQEPDVEIALRAAPVETQILSGRATRVWQFTGSVIRGPSSSVQQAGGSYLGPTLRFRRGQRVRIRFTNSLPEQTVVHWHGLDVPAAMDGHPSLAIAPGAEFQYDFTVRNRVGTYWYHPHPHGRTGHQVNAGLAGMIVVSDEEEDALQLPHGDDEILCVLQDRRFDADNQFVYLPGGRMDQMHGFSGNVMLVNGAVTPTLDLATRAYRLRLLNGSSSRIYKLELSDSSSFVVIGLSGGLLERPIEKRYLTLAPAQRADVILDFRERAPGTILQMSSAAYPVSDVDLAGGGMGRMGGAASVEVGVGAAVKLLGFRITRQERTPFVLPRRLSSYGASWTRAPSLPDRRLDISFASGEWKLGGRVFEMLATATDEEYPVGSSQVWEIVNTSGMMGVPMAHPIHLHGPPFRVLSRLQASDTASSSVREGVVDEGWTDTVLVLPGETVRIQTHFSESPGLYLYHCHNLEHEDAGMMRNFRLYPVR